MPWRMAAARIGSSRSTANVRSAGLTVMLKPIRGDAARTGAPGLCMDPRTTLLIVGCGDVGCRVLRLLGGRLRVLALTTAPERRAALRALGAVPLVGDLDRPATLGRLGGLADA